MTDQGGTTKPSSPTEGRDTGYRAGYQTSVGIESRALFGMEADDFYRRQMGIVLDEIPESLHGGDSLTPSKEVLLDRTFDRGFTAPTTLGAIAKRAKIPVVDRFDLGIGPDKRVLDVASGEGDTSRYFASTGATVEARDLSAPLVQAATERDAELRSPTEDARARFGKALGEVWYGIGDMLDVRPSLTDSGKAATFDVVACMCRSFIYLGTRERYEEALRNFASVVNPGGKVVLQWREHAQNGDLPWSEVMGTRLNTSNEAGDFIMEDTRTGDAFAWRRGTHQTLPDGVTQSTATRYLRSAEGAVQELGEVTSDDRLTLKNLPMWKEMLEKAGLTNVHLKAQELSPDGTEVMFALVAEKPNPRRVEGVLARIQKRLRGRR